MIQFDVDESERRYRGGRYLFDQLITFQLADLKGVTKLMHEVGGKPWPRRTMRRPVRSLTEARALIYGHAGQRGTGQVIRISSRRFPGRQRQAKAPRQAEFEQKWAALRQGELRQGHAKAEAAGKLAR